VVVHAGMYVTEAARITRGMIVQLLGWNMLGATLGLVGALFFEDVLVWWWLGAFVVAVVLPRLVRVTSLDVAEEDGGPSFELVPGHFVERHGLMLLIALGESVLAIGVGLGTGSHAIGVEQVVFAAISLLLAATLYWAYFGVGEDDRAEAALDAMPPERAQAAGLASYGYAFWVILFGIVLTASGLHHALVHPTEELTWEYAGAALRGRRALLGGARPLPPHAPPGGCVAAHRRWRGARGVDRGRCDCLRLGRTPLPSGRLGRPGLVGATDGRPSAGRPLIHTGHIHPSVHGFPSLRRGCNGY
jgi:Bacterial low temperature requirement A protein (LtrA)